MPTPPPDRSPDEVARVLVTLSTVGGCCPHTYALHRADRSCSVPRCGCGGWHPPADPGPVAAASVNALGDIRWLNLGPVGQGNAHLFGIEDSAALPCSTDGCGHRADQHYEKPDEPTGLGPCRLDGCSCGQWTYVIADDDSPPLGEVEAAADTIAGAIATAIGGAEDDDDTTRRVLAALRANRSGLEVILAADDVVDAEVLTPVHDALRAALSGLLDGERLEQGVDLVVTALEANTEDVADYLGLNAGGEVSAAELLRQVLMDYGPPTCHRGCSCSAARGRTFLTARGVQVD